VRDLRVGICSSHVVGQEEKMITFGKRIAEFRGVGGGLNLGRAFLKHAMMKFSDYYEVCLELAQP
jgi:hypothetical protein